MHMHSTLSFRFTILILATAHADDGTSPGRYVPDKGWVGRKPVAGVALIEPGSFPSISVPKSCGHVRNLRHPFITFRCQTCPQLACRPNPATFAPQTCFLCLLPTS